MIVVTDTSVVLNLCFLHQEHLLPRIFGNVLAPPSVQTEFQRLASLDLRFLGLKFPADIQVIAAKEIAQTLSNNQRLHQGEIDTLSLAVEQYANAVLMDELAGRTAASGLNLHCIGILGVLIQAKILGLLFEIKPLMDCLQSQAGFWMAPTLCRRVLQMVKE